MLSPKLVVLSRLTDYKAPRVACVHAHLPVLSSHACMAMHDCFFVGAGYLNAGPHACTASDVLNQPPAPFYLLHHVLGVLHTALFAGLCVLENFHRVYINSFPFIGCEALYSSVHCNQMSPFF